MAPPVVASAAGNLRADNFSLTIGSAGAPDPGTWADRLAGFGLSGALLRLRKRKAAPALASA